MTQNTRTFFLVAVHAFFIRNGQVLLLERANTGYMDGFFSVPAGHVDADESIWEAMRREIFEEVGVILETVHTPTHVMHRRSDQDRIDYFFVIEDWQGELTNTEPHKSAGISWHDLDSLPENVIPYVRKALGHVRLEERFSDFNERV